MPAIEVTDLSKTYKVPVRESGLRNSVRSLFKREFREVLAVDQVSFEVPEGQLIGFLGPNGAGKSTTLKMLSGLLYPTSGQARVLGHDPRLREEDYRRRIALVMGNRNSLQWDLPVMDSFELQRAIYQVPKVDFQRRRDEFIELLDVADLVTKPIRNLSLGERMKVEVIASLLHAPEVLFLDEPTLGLDVTMQKRLRGFIANYQKESGASIILTSHYMADVEALCDRIIVIHEGAILYDGDIGGLRSKFVSHRLISFGGNEVSEEMVQLSDSVEGSPERTILKVPNDNVADVASLLLRRGVYDLSIENVPLEDIIDMAFTADES
ncbi:MAG: ATP-binding cassette domain-containing protein [Acidimicrobiia bacterium]|nr:ATP-binding cassette domain-containing protein [Acidimicrobiia bacterium]MDH5503752.1 ATP-binding cassette domain-containing protein [Acidimicrobiia bacterium]